MIVTNVNSPRRVDEEILDTIMLMAEHGQCVVVTPFTLMGAMSPITLPGALAQQTAEALGIIALTQMIRPGAPAVLGGFTSNVDMRTGSPAFGTPEYVHATLGGAQIARRLKIPFRSSAVNASPTVDAQAAYETGFSLWASIMSHSHLINHAAGWLEGGLTASFEKIVVDAEMLREWAAILQLPRFQRRGDRHSRRSAAWRRAAISSKPSTRSTATAPPSTGRSCRTGAISRTGGMPGARDATVRATDVWKQTRDRLRAAAARRGRPRRGAGLCGPPQARTAAVGTPA